MQELIHALGIEWKVLIAQAVNFAVLVFILHRFLYKPILALLRKRREGLVEQKKNEEAAATRLLDIEKEREALVGEARKKSELILKETEKRGKELYARLATEAEERKKAIIDEGKKELALERGKLVEDFKMEARSLLRYAVENAFKGVSDHRVNEKLVDEAVDIMNETHR